MNFNPCTRTLHRHGHSYFVITAAIDREEALDIAAEWRHFGEPCRAHEVTEDMAASYRSDDISMNEIRVGSYVILGKL